MPKTSRAGSGCNDCSCKPSPQDILAPTLSHAQPAAGKRGFLQDLLAAAMAAVALPVAAAAPGTTGFQPPRRPGEAGKRYGMLVDLRRCIGCQACTVSCSMENLPPLGQFRTTVLQYEVQHAGNEDLPPAMLNLPRLCNHCDNPPCVPVCPVQATFQRSDGIVLVDNERCVGCGYCVQACPYDARFINHETQTADKCTFCEHRLEAGLLPACVESCVGGARMIGDLNDEGSEIRQRMREHAKDLKVLKPAMGTDPHVYYLGLPDAFVDGVDGQASVRLVTSH
ncbi:sulfate reduction electron transfer complex DsrMKJOP subunit DsrO [Delftia tsuruhatensis]|uniref:sulfate reduction electron transfer complex DsrMKJOP subunit DsrO n=1 Tax=Delftia tsuruhatensis TaxID=180282 RepID=UPI002091235B|nr:4Fe-4S dicluster domain-containing protein [Delftia tsuruhatensis]MCO5338215.1 4Fe-4S dicluster domain-containing protein [Delftia tsuruhatensis]MCR4543590.1 4Fe-4S dicluster domain-containing protein [Delftia tsuruhatensis]